jgi:hypothetical protein
MALWTDIVGVVIAVGILRWAERLISMRWPDSLIGKFFSPPPPFAAGSQELRLLESVSTAMGSISSRSVEIATTLGDIQGGLAENGVILRDI